MIVRDILIGDEGLNKIRAGIIKASNLVKTTMGARGRFVLIQTEGGGVVATKDGANTAAGINLKDPIENMGSRMVVEAAHMTAEQAGDGTTTTTVLMAGIIKRAFERIEKGYNPIALANEIERYSKIVLSKIKPIIIDRDDYASIKNIATISANGDEEVGDLVAKAVTQVGSGGSISILNSSSGETYSDVVNGLRVDTGYFSPYFINSPKRRAAEYDNPLIAITDGDFHRVDQIKMMAELAIDQNRPLIFIGDNFDGEAFQVMVSNFQSGGLRVCLVKAPGTGRNQSDILDDIAAVTNGTFITENAGLESSKWRSEWFGEAKRVSVFSDHMVITVDDKESYVDERIEEIRNQLKDEKNVVFIDKIKDRLARLDGGVGVVYVSADTDSALKEKKDRIEDSILAAQSALEEGIVPGGGKVYYELSSHIHGNPEPAAMILASSLRDPMLQIAKNAGYNADDLKDTTEADGYCFNVINGEMVDAIAFGIIDPAKVVRCAIQNAVNVAVVVIKSSGIIFTPNE